MTQLISCKHNRHASVDVSQQSSVLCNDIIVYSVGNIILSLYTYIFSINDTAIVIVSSIRMFHVCNIIRM